MTNLLAAVLLLVSITMLDVSFAASMRRRATTCNGSSGLCDRLYSNVTFAGAHNSYAITPSGVSSLAANQNVSLSNQLDAGVRMLQSQAHKSTNSSVTGAGIDLCHTSCSLFQGGALEYYLSQVKTWTDNNPNDVVTLLIVNSDGLPASQFAEAFQSTGLSSKMYSPSSGTLTRYQWPTLSSLIDSGKTVVGFITSEADTSSVPYLLDEFSNMWETPYDQTSVPFNCSIDRIGQSVTDATSIMYLSNQFRDVSLFGSSSGISTPDTANIVSTNSQQTTLQSSNTCAAEHNNVYPNFILTDYSTTENYSLMRAVAQMNGVTYTAPSNTASGGSTSSSGSSSSGSASIGAPISLVSLASLAALLASFAHLV